MTNEENKEGDATQKHPNPLRAVWKIDPERPVYSALLEAAFQRTDKLFDGSLIRRMNEVKSEVEVREMIGELVALLKEGEEILDWIIPQQPTPFELALKMATVFRQAGVAEDECKKLVSGSGRRRKGRPVTKRAVAIIALEKQLLEPERNWSYRQLAQQLCNCEKKVHDNLCGQSLRQSMLQLKKLLAKYAPHLPVNKSE